MENKYAIAFAPATVANVACGFDVLGFALDKPGDKVKVQFRTDNQVCIQEIKGDGGLLPLDPTQNTVSIVISEYLKLTGQHVGVDIYLEKQMPLKSGLGSSAASSVVGVYALNALLGNPLSKADLLPFVLKGEELACGAAHADNAAPALLGGIALVRSYDPLDVISLPCPDELVCTVVHPHINVPTKDARGILRNRIPMEQAVMQWGNLGGFVAGLYSNDYPLIQRSLKDVIVEPVRSILIPGFQQVKQAAIDAGALGCSISGSGPSIFALSKGFDTANQVAKSFGNVFDHLSIPCETYVSKINTHGPQILEMKN